MNIENASAIAPDNATLPLSPSPGTAPVLDRRGVGLQFKKLLRTAQIYFPFILDWKFAVMRAYRGLFKIPFEPAYRGLALFPDNGDNLCLDVGANRGQSTDAMLMMKKGARVQMYEPNEVVVEKLEARFRHDKRVELYRFGFGTEDSEAVLTMPIYKNWMFDGLTSLKHEHAANWLNGRIFGFNERHLTLKKIKCSIRRMDDLHIAPFFISIYIQGYEYLALKGAERTLRKHEPIVFVGDVDDRTSDYLCGLGYQFYCYDDGKFIPQVRGAPYTYFMTPAKAALVAEHIQPAVGSRK